MPFGTFLFRGVGCQAQVMDRRALGMLGWIDAGWIDSFWRNCVWIRGLVSANNLFPGCLCLCGGCRVRGVESLGRLAL